MLYEPVSMEISCGQSQSLWVAHGILESTLSLYPSFSSFQGTFSWTWGLSGTGGLGLGLDNIIIQIQHYLFVYRYIDRVSTLSVQKQDRIYKYLMDSTWAEKQLQQVEGIIELHFVSFIHRELSSLESLIISDQLNNRLKHRRVCTTCRIYLKILIFLSVFTEFTPCILCI